MQKSSDTIQSETLDLVKSVKPDVLQWLDTGCGTGCLVEMALPVFPHTQFMLADPSQAMLHAVRKRFGNEPAERVKIIWVRLF